MSKNIIITTLVIIFLIAGFWYLVISKSADKTTDREDDKVVEEEVEDNENTNEEEVVYEISFVPQEAEDMIRIDSPRPGERISSPLEITGEARGTWFFEASASVVLTDWDGLIIAEGPIEAQGDWMTEDFVPFSGTLTFIKPDFGERGNLIIKGANPSGLPENDRAAEMVIFFQ